MSERRLVSDPVCAFHGKHWSEHEGGRCLYCCQCFRTLTPEECWADESGQKWDICEDCGLEDSTAGGAE